MKNLNRKILGVFMAFSLLGVCSFAVSAKSTKSKKTGNVVELFNSSKVEAEKDGISVKTKSTKPKTMVELFNGKNAEVESVAKSAYVTYKFDKEIKNSFNRDVAVYAIMKKALKKAGTKKVSELDLIQQIFAHKVDFGKLYLSVENKEQFETIEKYLGNLYLYDKVVSDSDISSAIRDLKQFLNMEIKRSDSRFKNLQKKIEKLKKKVKKDKEFKKKIKDLEKQKEILEKDLKMLKKTKEGIEDCDEIKVEKISKKFTLESCKEINSEVVDGSKVMMKKRNNSSKKSFKESNSKIIDGFKVMKKRKNTSKKNSKSNEKAKAVESLEKLLASAKSLR